MLNTKERIDQLVSDHTATRGGYSGSLFKQSLLRMRHSPMALIGGTIVVLFLVLAILGPWIAPYDPVAQNWGDEALRNRNEFPGPRAENWFGVDHLGRDQFSRMLHGARQTLLVGVMAAALGFVFGAVLGGTAAAMRILGGRMGGRIDSFIMRVVDMMLAIPALLLALSIAALMGASLMTVMIAVGVAQVPIFARLLRGAMLAQSGSDYVLAATAVGVKKPRIVVSHVFPNALGPVIVQGTLTLATAIIEAAALSFLGLGNPDRSLPEWGTMLAETQDYLLYAPGLALPPALGIIITALGFTLLGEAMRESLDPKLRRQ
ncbi:ABC transporter permease [Haloglycomyces albus]|uniref:ABC transporter permease n=1 Tax=Haloglycomyces albus TaxID=526067 RepID=UPI00046D2330|nr:ABC transporter permease [Haloglycomyces albus]